MDSPYQLERPRHTHTEPSGDYLAGNEVKEVIAEHGKADAAGQLPACPCQAAFLPLLPLLLSSLVHPVADSHKDCSRYLASALARPVNMALHAGSTQQLLQPLVLP